MLRKSLRERKPIRLKPTMDGFDDRISRRLLRLTTQYSNWNKHLNPASWYEQGCVLFDLKEGSLKEREVFFLFDEWLDDRVLNREGLPVGFSGCKRFDCTVGLLVQPPDLGVSPRVILISRKEPLYKRVFSAEYCRHSSILSLVKLGHQWSRVSFPPPPPGFSEDLFAILLHLHDESARHPGLLVSRSPNEQLQKDRRQINPFLRQPIVHRSSIRLLRLRRNDPRRFELPQTICQDVRRNPFARLLELLIC